MIPKRISHKIYAPAKECNIWRKMYNDELEDNIKTGNMLRVVRS